MITCLRDDMGKILAVCEWFTVQDGVLADHGDTVIIAELEMNPECRGNGEIKKIIRMVFERNVNVKQVVWWREYKYPGRKPRIYGRETILKQMGGKYGRAILESV